MVIRRLNQFLFRLTARTRILSLSTLLSLWKMQKCEKIGEENGFFGHRNEKRSWERIDEVNRDVCEDEVCLGRVASFRCVLRALI